MSGVTGFSYRLTSRGGGGRREAVSSGLSYTRRSWAELSVIHTCVWAGVLSIVHPFDAQLSSTNGHMPYWCSLFPSRSPVL